MKQSPIIRFAEEAKAVSGTDPRSVVESHQSDPEAIIAAWTRDQALWMSRLDSLRHSTNRYRQDRDEAWQRLEELE